MTIGGIAGEQAANRQELFTGLIWGKPGCGKTVLAATAPGHKVWLQWDPNGTASLTTADDFTKFDFSGYHPLKMGNFKQGGSVEKELREELQALTKDGKSATVVVDSCTSYMEKALLYAIQSGKANVGKFIASLELPGMTGWGIRTALIIDMASAVLSACKATNAHCIFIAHEKQETDEKGNVTETTVALGGQAANALPLKLSEVWMLTDDGKDRRIYTRNQGVYKPIRSRMFLPNEAGRFTWKYDQQKDASFNAPHSIAAWYETWRENQFNKIKQP